MSQDSSKLKSVSRCYVSEEGISYHDDGTTSYMIQIEDFAQKMEWTPGTKITSQVFQVQGIDLYIIVYPNGLKSKGLSLSRHVAVIIRNSYNSVPAFAEFEIELFNMIFKGDGWLKPGYGLGTPLDARALHHDDVVARFGVPLDSFSVKCRIKRLYKSRKSLQLHQEVHSIHERLRSVEAKVDGKLDKLLENRKITKPRCPICFEKMTASTKIAQCINGHHLCWGCKERLEKKVCPSCAKPVNGRAFGMESYLRTIFAGTQ